MHTNYKIGEEVKIIGFGKNNKNYYYYRKAVIIEYDIYYKDYCVRFKNGTIDWLSPKFIRKIKNKRSWKKWKSNI